MSSADAPKKKWVFYGKWALSPTIVGIGVLIFVILTGEKYAWTLWIGLPMLMVGLGYIFIINAIAAVISIGSSDGESDGEQGKEDAE